MSQQLFTKKFVFGPGPEEKGYIRITCDTMYTPETGYGFVTEITKQENELMKINELGSAFNLAPQFEGQNFTNILMEDRGGQDNLRRGFCYSDKPEVPLNFKIRVPRSGNYNIKYIIGDSNEATNVTVFSQRRRCMIKNASAEAGKFIEGNFTINLCDIIPRGKERIYHDDTVDITILGTKSCINAITIEEILNIPTIYIAGDSTVTDQSAEYPYNPANSYSGWAQMFPGFLEPGLAVSNQSHSGLTTESFRNGGHYAIVESVIKPNDFFFMQFGHNDQKIKSLDAFGGYADNLRRYVDEIREKGAFPVIITPVSRSIWTNPDDSFNDLLYDNAMACIQVATEKHVPLIDLHGKSVAFIKQYGPEAVKKFFFPGDHSHHNDYGAYEMAKFVVEGIKEANIESIIEYLKDIPKHDSVPTEFFKSKKVTKYVQIVKPEADELSKQWLIPEFKNIEKHLEKSDIEDRIRLGLAKGVGNYSLLDKSVTRAEFLDILLRVLMFPPANVYNDIFMDVFGDEWYAGVLQAAYDKKLIPSVMIVNENFKPMEFINGKEMALIVTNAHDIWKNINIKK